MKALHFGAGNIGRGFIGQLLSESGYEVVFVDINPTLVALLNERQYYPLRLVSVLGDWQTPTIGPVRAIHSSETEKIRQELATADIASTSVGANILSRIAPELADGIEARAATGRGLDILLCENKRHASAHLRSALQPLLSPAANTFFTEKIGIVETVIGRMVPHPVANAVADDPLLIVTEPYAQFPCARAMFKNPVPPITGLRAVPNFEAYEARKLFLHNMGHALLAYAGADRYRFLYECVADPMLLRQVTAAMAEVQRALVKEFGFDVDELAEHVQDLMRRFTNRAIQDTVFRVAHDPLRKLGPDERLVGAATLCLRNGIIPTYVCQGIAAALRYSSADDPAAIELQQDIAAKGVSFFLSHHCHIERSSPLYALILQTYR